MREHRDEFPAVLIEHIHGVIVDPQRLRIDFFIPVYGQAIDVAHPACKPLGKLRSAHPDMENLRPGERHGVEDRLDVDWQGGLMFVQSMARRRYHPGAGLPSFP